MTSAIIKAKLDAFVARSFMNWSRLAQSDPEFMEMVEQATANLPANIPMRDRIYAAASSSSPVCPHGRFRTLKNIAEGWKGCGRAGVCACSRELVSDANARTKAARREAVRQEADQIAAGSVLMQDSDGGLADMRQRLLAIITETPPKQISSRVGRDASLLGWIMAQTASVQAEKLAERIYLALHGVEQATCPFGQAKVFNTVEKGYRFCASDCHCRREEQARKMRQHHAGTDNNEKARRLTKQRQTMVERYGAENVVLVPRMRERIEQTNLSKYGATTPFGSKEIRRKAAATLIERHGVHAPALVPGVMEKVAATNLERYGATNTMHIARTAFFETHNGQNPFQVPEIAQRADASMLARHGVRRALQSSSLLAKMQAEFAERNAGATNPMLVPEIKARVRSSNARKYGRPSPMQAHFDDAAWAILTDPDAFRAMFKGRALREVATELGLAYDTCRKWCDRHGVELPRSSYEDAIRDFLMSNGLVVRTGDRTIIKPREIDLVIESARVGIEFCGLLYHSDNNFSRVIEPRYHAEKMEAANRAGYRLVTIFEDEWLYRRSVVQTRLLHIIGCAERGKAARKLTIAGITAGAARSFLDRYHIQGGGVEGFARYGAFDGDDLVAVMTFSLPRKMMRGQPGGPVELLRFATDGRSFTGVASRLFSAFRREYDPERVISYADLRWSEGGLYRALGFEELPRSGQPGYTYFNPNKKLQRVHRWRMRRDVIRHLVEESDGKTEQQMAAELGFYRIYDCGVAKFLWRKP